MRITSTFFFTVVFIFSVLPVFASSDFCRGFEKGYQTGYKEATGSSFGDVTPPWCPSQPMKKFSDPDSDFEHGYIIGYKKGIKKGN